MIDLATIERATALFPVAFEAMTSAEALIAESEVLGVNASRLRAALGVAQEAYLEMAWWVDQQL